ncbi:MAG: glycosyltransferase family 4 protein [Candidatus Lokiarchaeota archaeon]|nr:glycosyltransferase family 4 protein [Candidatus Lokiarchaeota archaeon]
MNIIYIVNFHIYKNLKKLDTVGGIEVTTEDIIKELKNRQHNVWVPQREKKPGWVKKGNVDIICSSSFDPITLFQLYKLKKKYRKTAAIVQHAHTTYEDLKGNVLPNVSIINKLVKLYVRLLYSQAHLLITPSDYAKSCIEGIQKTQTYPILSVSSGIILKKYSDKKNYRDKFREYINKKYNIPKDAIIILNVGLIWKRKRVDTFCKIAKNLPNYYFIWVGPINNSPEVEKASNLNNVFFTGFYEDIREPYFGADILLNTSDEENLCLPLIEASLCYLPIVARDIEVFNWLEHDLSAYKAKTLNDFIQGIEKILKDSNYKKKLIENACDQAKKMHDFNDTVDRIEIYFDKALKIKKIWDRLRN